MLRHRNEMLMPLLAVVQDALEVALQMALSMPLADIMAFRKVSLVKQTPVSRYSQCDQKPFGDKNSQCETQGREVANVWTDTD